MNATDYACRNAACGEHGKSIPGAFARLAQNKCPSCGETLFAVVSSLSETTQRVIESYPYPIALPLQLLHKKVDVEARAKSLVDVFTSILKLQAMVVQSEYLQSHIVDEELTGIIRRDLARPLVSAWSKFLEAALPRLEGEGYKFFVPELKTAYESAETRRKRGNLIVIPGKGYYNLDGDLVETKSKLGLVRALISYRNKFSHGFNQPEEESRQELEFYLSVLDTLLEEMAWMADYPLLKREDGKVWRMMGASPEQMEIRWPEEAGTSLALLCPEGGRALALFPLFIVPREHIAETAAGEDLLIYDQDTGKRLIYVSPRGHHREIESTLRPWRKLVQTKEVVLPELRSKDLTPKEIGKRAGQVSRDTEERLYSSRKVLKGIYVNRHDAERHLRFYPGSSFPLALVTSQAGGGKTCLLHHLANQWAKEGMSVVLLRAMAVKNTDLMSALRDELRLSDEVDAKNLAERGASEERPLIVVLDGLNEHGQREVLLASILALATEVREARHLKLVLSWRSEQANWADTVKEHVALFLPGPESSTAKDDEIPRLHLGRWSHEEVAMLWKALEKSDKQRFSQGFSHSQVYEKSRAVADLLKNPLLVRLFLEAFSGEKLPQRLSYQGIFEHWLEKLGERTGDANRLLYDMARILMDRGLQAVEQDALYDDPRTAETVRRTDVASPFNRLIRREGVLALVSSNDRVNVSFTMDRFLEQAAGTVLVLDGKAERPEDLVAALEGLKEHRLAEEIVEVALTRRVVVEGREYLWEFIDAVPRSAGSIAGELVGRMVEETQEAKAIAAELTASPSESDMQAAIKAGDYLAGENLFTLQREFLGAVVQSASEALPASETLADLIGAAASAAYTLNDWEACRAWNDQALVMRQGLFGEWHADVASSYNNLGNLLSDLGEHQQARECHEKSLAIKLHIYGEQHADVATSYNDLGHLLNTLSEHRQARKYYEKCLAIRLSVYGEQHADVAESYNNLAYIFHAFDEHQQASEYLEKSLAIELNIYGEQHAGVALRYNNLGMLLASLGEHQQARKYHERSLAIRLNIYGEQHADVATSYNNLGHLLYTLGEYQQAREYLEKSLAINRDIYGEQHASVAMSYNNLGELVARLDEHQQAREYYEKSLAIYCYIYGEQHAEVARNYYDLGRLLAGLGEHQQAREYYEKSLTIWLNIYGEKHAGVAASYNNLGVLLAGLGEHQQAREYLEKSLAIRLNIYGEQHADVATSFICLASLLLGLGEHQPAREYFEKSLSIRLNIYGKQHAEAAIASHLLGDVLAALGRYDDAEKQYRLAAEAGNEWSMLALGRRGLLGDDEGCQKEGVSWLERAAEAGNAEAVQLLEGLGGSDPLAQVKPIRQRMKEKSEDNGEQSIQQARREPGA